MYFFRDPMLTQSLPLFLNFHTIMHIGFLHKFGSMLTRFEASKLGLAHFCECIDFLLKTKIED
jgi:hypothetical protein